MKQTLLVMAVILLGGCGTYEELQLTYDTECRGQRTEECRKLEDRLIAIEEIQARKRAKEAYKVACIESGYKLYCEKKGVDEQCQCLTREEFQNVLDQIF